MNEKKIDVSPFTCVYHFVTVLVRVCVSEGGRGFHGGRGWTPCVLRAHVRGIHQIRVRRTTQEVNIRP